MRYFKLAAVLTLWALSFILNDVALRSFGPMAVVAGRWVVTAALILGLLVQRGQLRQFGAALRADFWRFALLSLVGVTLLYGLQVAGQARTSAINTGLLANMVPVFTALLAVVFLHQRLRLIGWVAIVVALLGVWIISTGGLRLEFRSSSALGDLLVVVSSLAAALYFVYGARLLKVYPPFIVTAAAAVLGAATLVPIALIAGEAPPSGPVWPAVAAVVVLGIGPGLLANLWWWETVEWLDASRAAVYVYLIPLITMVFAVIFLGEQVSLAQLAGAALVLGGVAVAERAMVVG